MLLCEVSWTTAARPHAGNRVAKVKSSAEHTCELKRDRNTHDKIHSHIPLNVVTFKQCAANYTMQPHARLRYVPQTVPGRRGLRNTFSKQAEICLFLFFSISRYHGP